MNLSFKDYQASTARTAIYGGQIDKMLEPLALTKEQSSPIKTLLRVSYVSNGLGEAGEVQNKIKKIIRDDGGVITPERRRAIAKELGGNLWYISQCATELGLTLEEIAQGNLDELESRQQRGVLKGSGDER